MFRLHRCFCSLVPAAFREARQAVHHLPVHRKGKYLLPHLPAANLSSRKECLPALLMQIWFACQTDITLMRVQHELYNNEILEI